MSRYRNSVTVINKERKEEVIEVPEKSSYISTLKNLVSLFPIFTILIIIIGLIRLNLYYSGFGINILHFIKISEVVVIVAMDLLTVLLSIIGTTLIAIIPSFTKNDFTEHKTNHEANERRSKKTKSIFKLSFLKSNRLDKWRAKNKDKIDKTLIYSVRILFWAFLMYCLYTIFNYETHEELLQGISLLILSSPFTLTALSPSFMEAIFTSASRIFGLLFFAMASFYFLNRIERDYIETNSGKYKGTSVICADTTQKHVSTLEYFYIGKTEDYIFFYNKKIHHRI